MRASPCSLFSLLAVCLVLAPSSSSPLPSIGLVPPIGRPCFFSMEEDKHCSRELTEPFTIFCVLGQAKIQLGLIPRREGQHSPFPVCILEFYSGLGLTPSSSSSSCSWLPLTPVNRLLDCSPGAWGCWPGVGSGRQPHYDFSYQASHCT